MDIIEAKTERKILINRRCTGEITLGFTSSALGELHHYDFESEDQTNMQAMFLISKELNEPRPFKCTDISGVTDYRMHTFAQLVQLGLDAETHKLSALIKANTLKNMIDAAETVDEINTINWDTPIGETP